MTINRFWITEKPDMARNLAAGLALTYGAKVVNEKAVRQDGCIRLDNGDAVGYLFGHMLQLAPPEGYLTEEQNKGDVFHYLPLMPQTFLKLPKPERLSSGEEKRTRDGKPVPQYQLVKLLEHIRAAREIVNAGDTDREGQLIVDELLMHAGVDPRGADKPVWRLALQNPKDEEIRKLILTPHATAATQALEKFCDAAPTIATMLKGPLAARAVTVLEDALGLPQGVGAEKVVEAIKTRAGGEVALLVRQADQHAAVSLRQSGISLERANQECGLELNSDPKWARRYKAAYSRETFDWCLGMTASRAYRQVTGFNRMSVGRVTTPTMMLVVDREIAIENFKPVQYFVPVITLQDGTQMRWFRRAGAEGTPGFDQQGRMVNEAVARQIVSAILGGCKGEISLAEALKKFQPPPLPHSLGTLQSTVSRRTGMTLKEVTRAAQSLYEQHKMITYVGTDCRFLPTSMLQESHDIVQGLAKIYTKQAMGADLQLRSKAWDDGKTDEHFAIAPTGRIASGLNEAEKKVFEVVTQRFLAQFYPAHEFVSLRLQAMFGQDEFKANDREVVKAGWKAVEYDPDDKEAGDADELGEDAEKKTERRVARELQ